MTTLELHELVQHWPREAWPECITGWIRGAWVECRAAEQTDKAHCVHAFLFPDDALLMFEASGLRWLIEHTTSFHTMRTSKGDVSIEHFGLGDDAEWITSTAPTLIAAIDAAIKGASK